jgi:hypothetical protein
MTREQEPLPMKTFSWIQDFSDLLNHFTTAITPCLINDISQSTNNLFLEKESFIDFYGQENIHALKFDIRKFTQDFSMKPQSISVTLEQFMKDKMLNRFFKIYDNDPLLNSIKQLEKIINKPMLDSYSIEGKLKSYYFRYFLGLEGQLTAPHVDWSCTNNILFQLFGSKEVLLISTDEFHHFDFFSNFLELNHDELKKKCIDENIAHELFTIKSGQAVYIPLFICIPFAIFKIHPLTL